MWYKEHRIKPKDILNFDKARFQVRVALREEIIVLAYVKEVSLLLYIIY